MLSYSPPKSSIWGHLMGRKKPAAFRAGVADFLGRAARRHETEDCSVTAALSGPADIDDASFVRAFIAETGFDPDAQGATEGTPVAESDFERYLDWLVAHKRLLPKDPCFDFSLIRRHRIHGWNLGPSDAGDTGDATADIGGELTEAYGALQYLGTAFTFRSVEEYRCVQQIARETLGIRMNDAHVRPRKALASAPGLAPQTVRLRLVK